MPAFIIFGRVLFAVLFIYSGATKLFAIQPTADAIAAKVTFPAILAPYTQQLETLTGMPTPQVLAIAGGAFEILAGLMIALHFGVPFSGFLLSSFLPAAPFDFIASSKQVPHEKGKPLIDALENPS